MLVLLELIGLFLLERAEIHFVFTDFVKEVTLDVECGDEIARAYRGANEDVTSQIRFVVAAFVKGNSRFGEVLRKRLLLRLASSCWF